MRPIPRSSSDYYIEKIIKTKKQSPLISSPIVTEDVKQIFDELIVFGLRPDPPPITLRSRNEPPTSPSPYGPQMLVMFPSTNHTRTNEEYEQIASFCFPNGFHSCGPPSNELVIQAAYPFYLTSNQTRTYCFCIQFLAPSDTPPFFSTHFSRRYPFSICILSKLPYIAPFAQFLTFLVSSLCGCGKPLEFPVYQSKLPHVGGFCVEPLKLDAKYPTFAVLSNIRITKFFFEAIDFFYSLPLTTTHDIHLSANYLLQIPQRQNNDDTKCLIYPTIYCLLSTLSPPNVVKLYSAILCDFHIMLYSKNLLKAALCVIAAECLIKPFISTSTIVPILPNSFFEVLQTPTPYIIGSCKKADTDVIIDLDLDEVTETVQIPVLPDSLDLVHKLKLVIESAEGGEENTLVLPTIFKAFEPPKVKTSPFFVDSVIQIFENHLPPRLAADIQPFFITDRSDKIPVTVLNTELFLESIQDIDRPFYTQFSMTQAFDDYVNRLTDTYSQIKENALNGGRLFFSD